MKKISACLVVINEEKLIGRCLESLRGVVDEIILVHDGDCCDKTLDIARSYGAKVYVESFVGGAEEHRPFSFSRASNNWILQIDADEYLSSELRNNLRNLVNVPEISAYELLWPLWNKEREVKAAWPYKRCLFRKDKISFLGILQFIVEVEGPIKKINYKLEHRPAYNNYSFASFITKQLPWARLQAKYYLQDFSAIKKFNYQVSDWPTIIRLRRKFPLLLIPADFSVTFLKNIFSGAYKAGLLGLRISLRAALYRSALDYYIYKLKK